MPKNPSTPPNDTRKSQRFCDNTNPLWAPKVDKENASPNTQYKRKRKEIESLEKEVTQETFFNGRTAQGKCRIKMMKDVLKEKEEELGMIEHNGLFRQQAWAQPNFDLVLPGMWAHNPIIVEPVLSEGMTTGESSEVNSDASSEVSDNDSGFSTPRSVTPSL
jgi:hypothetical protein